MPPHWWPDVPTLDNYRRCSSSATSRAISSTAASSRSARRLGVRSSDLRFLGFARFDFRASRCCQAFVLVGQLLPTAAIIVPLFITLRVLGLVNTYWGLILVYMVITLPLSVWIRRATSRRSPELDEAAIIDGASRLDVLFRITLHCRCRDRRGLSLRLRDHLERVHLRALFRDRLLVEDAADRPLRVLDRVHHRLGAVMAASMVMTLPGRAPVPVHAGLFVGGRLPRHHGLTAHALAAARSSASAPSAAPATLAWPRSSTSSSSATANRHGAELRHRGARSARRCGARPAAPRFLRDHQGRRQQPRPGALRPEFERSLAAIGSTRSTYF